MKSNINRIMIGNISVALSFILILSGSTVLTGSTLGQVSQTQQFGQMQHQETPLKLWTIDPPANNSQTADMATPISDGDMNATNAMNHANVTATATATASKAVSTNFNPYTSVNVQKLITNIRGPVQIGFVNSYWTSNTAQDQFVAGTQSGDERLLNSITGSGSLTNEFVTGSPSGPASDIALQPVVKQEVAPGEGPSLLAVTLVNQGFSAITGITSSLELPQGFEPLFTPCCSSIPGSNPQTALSSFNGVVEPGDSFTLYFGVKVLGNAQVGKQYNSALKLGYTKVTELRGKLSRSEIIAVPFSITGRVILDLVSYSPPLSSISNVSSLANSSLTNSSSAINLYPGFPNLVNLSLKNVGSAIARGVIVNIAGLTSATQVAGVTTQVTVATNVSSGIAAQPTSSSTVILGPKVFNIGIVPPGASKLISLVIYPSIAAAGTVQTLSLTMSFDDAYGNRASTNQLVGLQILPISPQTGLTVTPSSPTPPPSLSPTPPPSLSPTPPPSLSPTPPPSSSSSYSTSPSTSQRNQILTKVASFVHSSSTTGNDIRYGASNPSPSTYSPIQLTAGKIQNVTFAINNNNARFPLNVSPLQNSITNLGISLVSNSSLVSILGPSTWNFPTILPGSAERITTQVFVPKSLLDTPVAFTVKVQYSQYGHQLKTASFGLGAIVIGDIQLKVNNLGISYIGNNPFLVGSVVNEGNTPAQFVNVEMLQQGQSQSQQASVQYLGNIATNSTKPINIPLQGVRILSNSVSSDKNEVPLLTRIALNSSAMKSFGTGVQNNTNPGIYPVSLKLTYYDDLKNSHDLIVDSPVQINPVLPEGISNQGNGLFPILIAAIIIAVGIAVILLGKWPESFSTYKLLSRITRKIEGAHPPDEKREGAPFSPI